MVDASMLYFVEIWTLRIFFLGQIGIDIQNMYFMECENPCFKTCTVKHGFVDETLVISWNMDLDIMYKHPKHELFTKHGFHVIYKNYQNMDLDIMYNIIIHVL